MKVDFFVPGQPQGKGRAKVTTRGRYAHAYTPAKTVAYEDLIKTFFYNNDCQHLNGMLKLTVKAFYKIPQSFSRKKRNDALNGNLAPLTKPDVDNILKVVCDALNGIAYEDDKQIVYQEIYKYYDEVPRLQIEIKEVEIKDFQFVEREY